MIRLVAAMATLLASLAVAGAPGSTAAAIPTCNGQAATIVGTSGRDVIRGRAGVDVIVARGGPDVIDGRLDEDVICGGRGADVIRGGARDDLLLGGAGNDHIEGGDGHDAIRGGPGGDELSGGAVSDRIHGGEGDAIIFGDAKGADPCCVSEHHRGYDYLYGGPGDDRLAGGPACDQLWGHGGDDELDGGSNESCRFDFRELDDIDFCRQGPGSGALRRCETGTITDVVAVSVSAPEEVDDKLIPITVTARNDGSEVVSGIRLSGLGPGNRYFGPDCTGGLSPWDDVPLAVGRSRDIQMVMDCAKLPSGSRVTIKVEVRIAGLDTDDSNDHGEITTVID